MYIVDPTPPQRNEAGRPAPGMPWPGLTIVLVAVALLACGIHALGVLSAFESEHPASGPTFTIAPPAPAPRPTSTMPVQGSAAGGARDVVPPNHSGRDIGFSQKGRLRQVVFRPGAGSAYAGTRRRGMDVRL